LALGAATGDPNRSTIALKTGCALRRTATVGNPELTKSGTISRFGNTNVSGPGQNRATNPSTTFRTAAGISVNRSNQE